MNFRGMLCLLLAGSAWGAWEAPNNPDRWLSVQTSISGNLPLTGEQDVVIKGQEEDQNTRSYSVNPAIEAILPVSDALTIQAGTGFLYSQSTADAGPHLPGTAADIRSVTYDAVARFYGVEEPLVDRDTSRNPDRWPSFALNVSGNESISQSNAVSLNNVGRSRDDQATSLTSVGGELRLPISNRFTLLSALTASFTHANTPETAASAGIESKTTDLTVTMGYRYFFLDNNYIQHNRHKNPDQWNSFTLLMTGTRALHGNQTFTLNGSSEERNVGLGAAGLNAELRLPVTDAITLRFSAGGLYTEATANETPTHASGFQATSQVNLAFGIRYYFI